MGSGSILTFYSFKGGTGRSMALANVAWILATSGYRVLAVDWDLEAPGLHRYFHPFLPDPELEETDGLIDMIWDLAHRTSAGRAPDAKAGAGWKPNYDDYRVRLAWDHFPSGGLVDFVPAGRQGPMYAELVNSLDWGVFYSQLGGRRHLDDFREWMAGYDYALLDSRTGVSDSSGICTVQLPDRLVACTTLNRQSLAGVHAVVDSVRKQRPEIEIYPVITRVELQEKDALDAARPRARRLLSPYLPESVANPTMYWTDTEVLYRTYYAYEEVLATFGDRTGLDRSDSDLLAAFERISRRVSGDAGVAMAELPEALRRATVERYLDRGAGPGPGEDAGRPEAGGRRPWSLKLLGFEVPAAALVTLVALVVTVVAGAWLVLRRGSPEISFDASLALDGAGPYSIASGEGAIWVASRDGEVHRVDQGGLTVSARSSLGADVTAVAVGEGLVWAVREGVDESALLTLDPATAESIDLAQLGADPARGVAAGFGGGWLPFADKVVLLSSEGLELMGETPLQVAASADETHVVVGDSAIWVAVGTTLLRVDANSLEITADLTLVEAAGDLAFGEGAVWVSGSDSVIRVDVARSTVAAAVPVTSPGAITVGLGAVWVTSEGRALVRIDPDANEIVQTLDLGSVGDVVAGQGAVWVVDERGPTVDAVRVAG